MHGVCHPWLEGNTAWGEGCERAHPDRVGRSGPARIGARPKRPCGEIRRMSKRPTATSGGPRNELASAGNSIPAWIPAPATSRRGARWSAAASRRCRRAVPAGRLHMAKASRGRLSRAGARQGGFLARRPNLRDSRSICGGATAAATAGATSRLKTLGTMLSAASSSGFTMAAESRPSASGSLEARAVSEAEPDRHRLAERLVEVEHPDRALSFDDRQVTDAVLPRKEGGCGDRRVR